MKPNFEEILHKVYDEKYRKDYCTEYSKACIIDAMREVWYLAIQTVDENVKIDASNICVKIDRESILKLKV